MQMWVEARVGNSHVSLRLSAPSPGPRFLPFRKLYVSTLDGCFSNLN